MDALYVRPKGNLIYSVESSRLTAAIHSQLVILKARQTKEALNTFQSNLETLLFNSIDRVAYSGYLDGAKAVGFTIDAALALRIKRESRARAKQSAEWMAQSTGTALDIIAAMSKVRALSVGRAEDAAVNELSLAFFGGTRYGWGLDKRARKVWHLSSWHDQDDMCDDNADEGPIGINEVFQSGHFIPPAHIRCECELGLVRIKR